MSVPDKSIDPRLLESAKQEFQKQGFLKAELKSICEGTGITTGAVNKIENADKIRRKRRPYILDE